jgi:hypothetical protein
MRTLRVSLPIAFVLSFFSFSHATEAVSPSHPATSYPADFLFYLDPCPFDDDYTFYVVITDLDDQFVAIGSGAGTAGFAMVTPDLNEFEDGLPDGVYKAWIRDSEDPHNESFSFAFAVLRTAAPDGGVTATNVAATINAVQFLGRSGTTNSSSICSAAPAPRSRVRSRRPCRKTATISRSRAWSAWNIRWMGRITQTAGSILLMARFLSISPTSTRGHIAFTCAGRM